MQEHVIQPIVRHERQYLVYVRHRRKGHVAGHSGITLYLGPSDTEMHLRFGFDTLVLFTCKDRTPFYKQSGYSGTGVCSRQKFSDQTIHR